MILGECNCGAVAFKISANIREIIICHCSICRKSTGANGIPVVVVNNESFAWERGEESTKTWHKPTGDWQTTFCQHCGSPLPGPNGEESMYVPAGLLREGAETLRVAHHIFGGSKAGWDVIGDDGEIHLERFEGKYEIPG